MQTTRIYKVQYQPPKVFERLKTAQQEAAAVWNACMSAHKECRTNNTKWLSQADLQKLTKGKFELHSQSVQMVCQAFIANIDTTRENRRRLGNKMKYPWRHKRFYPVSWAAQAVKYQSGRLILPMGRGREPLVLKVDITGEIGAVSLIWNYGFEVHVKSEVARSLEATSSACGRPDSPALSQKTNTTGNKATVDLGEINLGAVTTSDSQAMIVTGRGIRSLKRQRNIAQSKIKRVQSKCQKYSRRWKRLQRAKNRLSRRIEKQVRDIRHKATRQIVEFCKTRGTDTVFIGNPNGVRDRDCGRHHNQRISQWEYGKDINYLTYKFKLSGIKVLTGSERGTSSHCPVCGKRKKVKGRDWKCSKCDFRGNRDAVGSANMHPIAFGQKIEFPTKIMYLRPITWRSRCDDTRQSSLSKSIPQAPVSTGESSISAQSIGVA
jgi:putative transposase